MFLRGSSSQRAKTTDFVARKCRHAAGGDWGCVPKYLPHPAERGGGIFLERQKTPSHIPAVHITEATSTETAGANAATSSSNSRKA